MAPLTSLIALLTALVYCEGANILFVVPFTSKSHYIMLSPIGLELARRGHKVTAITGIKEPNPPANYHQVMVDDVEIWDVIGKRPNVFDMAKLSAEEFHDLILWGGGLAFTEVALNSTQVRKLLLSDKQFDLVISEQFFQEATYILAHKYQAPLVLVTTFGNCMRHNIVTRNPLQLATVLAEFVDVKSPTSFLGRLRNWYFVVYEYVWWRYWFLEKHEILVKKYVPNLPEPVPSLYEMQKNVSLILMNTHFSFDTPAAYLPNVVEVAGVHLSKGVSEIPEDLKTVLDNAKDGVIYVNFGSNVRSAEMPNATKNSFINVFRRLKQTVLWKWEDDNMDNKPDNLLTRKWFPQKDILAHPNIKVFISHGGLIGTEEAIFHGVPILGIPIYADQYNNLLQAQDKGFGKVMQFNEITEHTLQKSLLEILNNESYKNKAKEVSERFKDRPMSALDTAMYWIEYVIRHKGADFIKNPARNMSWLAYTMLDVYAFVLFIVFVLLYSILKVFSLVLGNENVNTSKVKTKKL